MPRVKTVLKVNHTYLIRQQKNTKQQRAFNCFILDTNLLIMVQCSQSFLATFRVQLIFLI